MKHLRSINFAICALLLAFISACASNAAPDTFNKRIAAAYVTVNAVADSATAALTAGKITKADATNVVTTTRAALQAIDVANAIHANNPQAGEDKLAATLAVLTALQAYLATQGVK
jgi:hypothetical protein